MLLYFTFQKAVRKHSTAASIRKKQAALKWNRQRGRCAVMRLEAKAATTHLPQKPRGGIRMKRPVVRSFFRSWSIVNGPLTCDTLNISRPPVEVAKLWMSGRDFVCSPQ